MALTREQRRVATTIYRRGRRKHVKRKSLLAAIETGLVESGLRNLPGGSGSSVGWRQEISSYGSRRRRMNVAGGADRFFDEIKAKGGSRHFGSAGQVAQAVQRSAYPGRYDQQAKQAKDILRWLERTGGSGGGAGSHVVGGDVKGKLQTIPGVSMAADRLAAKQQYLLSDSKNPDALLHLGQQLNDLQDTPAQQIYKLSKTPLRRVGGKGGKGGGHYVHPFPGAAEGRTDQGVDFTGRGRILAIGNAVVLHSTSHASGWPEGGWVSYKLLDGPHKGKVVYVAEGIAPHVRPGQRVRRGQQVASFRGRSIETGWATGKAFETLARRRGHVAGGSHFSGEGAHFKHFLHRLRHHHHHH